MSYPCIWFIIASTMDDLWVGSSIWMRMPSVGRGQKGTDMYAKTPLAPDHYTEYQWLPDSIICDEGQPF